MGEKNGQAKAGIKAGNSELIKIVVLANRRRRGRFELRLKMPGLRVLGNHLSKSVKRLKRIKYADRRTCVSKDMVGS